MTTTPTIWSGKITPYVNAGGAQGSSQIIGLANGNYLTIWNDNQNGPSPGNDTMGQMFDAQGNKVGGLFQLNTVSTADGEAPGVITALPDGGFVVAYIDDEGAAADTIRLERYNASGSVVFTTFIAAGGTVSSPQLSVTPNGNYMLTFTRDSAGDQNVRAHVFNGATNAATAEFNAGENAATDNAAGVVAGLNNGNFVTIDTVSGTGVKFKIVNSAGTQVVAPVTVGTGFGGDVAALTGGGFAVAWTDSVGGSGDVKLRFATSAGVLGAAITVAGGANAQSAPQIVGLKDGGVFVTWLDTTLHQLIGQRYSSAGALVGANLVIDSGSNLGAPNLGLTTDGRILVTYFGGVSGNEVKQLVLDPRDATITGTGGADVITTRLDDTVVFAGNGSDTVFGQGGNDTINGGFGTDTIFGGGGNDTVKVLEGEFIDNVDGGDGTDTLDLSAITSRAADVNLATGLWRLTAAFGGIRTVVKIETVKGTALGDTLTGSALADTLIGNGGDDIINGGAGGDTLDGGAGSADLLTYAGATGRVDVSLATGLGTFGDANGDHVSNFENLTGGDGNDTLAGNDGDNIINGGLGNDTINGLGGNDTIIGDNGNDIISGGDGNDVIDGGLGADSVDAGAGNDTVKGSVNDDILAGGADTDTIIYDNFATGITVDLRITAAQNTGAGGIDTISGFENISGGLGNDVFIGTNIANTLDGNAGNDTLSGLGGADILIGGSGDDNLRGGFGNDTITGGLGLDIMKGEGDADTFVFASAAETAVGSQRDRITDFLQGADKIDLSAIDAIPGGGDDPFDLIGSAAFSGTTPGELRFTAAGANTLIQGDIDGNGIADFEILVIGTVAFVDSDFAL